MYNNSVMMRAELNKDSSESIVSKETNLAVQKYATSNKIAMLDFSGAKGPISITSLVKFNSEQQIITEQSSVSNRHQDIGDHDLRSNKKALSSQHSIFSGLPGTTGQAGSGRLVRPIPAESVVGGHQEERKDIIHIKVPRPSNIFDKVCCTSKLFNSQSDHVVSFDASNSKIIVSNPRRLIEEGNLLASIRVISDSVGQCIVKNRKADNSNTLAFKITPSSLPKIFSKWFTRGHSGIKSKKPKLKSIVESDDDVVISSKASDIRSTRKGIAEWINEESKQFICSALKPSC